MRGMLLGAAAPWVARRLFTPLGFAAMGAYGAKKYLDGRKARANRGDGSTPSSRS